MLLGSCCRGEPGINSNSTTWGITQKSKSKLGIRSSGGAKSSSSGALADNGPTPVLSDSADWLKEYLDGARKQVDERYRANPKSEGAPKDYKFLSTLGAGSFGRVMLATTKGKDDKVNYWAIKILNKEMLIKMKQVEHTLSEKRLLQAVNHPFIVFLHGSYKDASNLYLIMDYVYGGELFLLIRRKGRLPEAWAQFYSSQVLLALQYLHYCNIVYRDLKPENIMIDHKGYTRLGDFGFAKRVDRGITWTLCGTPQYLAPEIILSKGYGKSVDYWGFGILIYELISGQVPFDHKTPIKLYELIVECKLTFTHHFKPNAQDLLSNIITTDLTRRFGNLKNGAFDIINHQWYQEVDFRKIMSKAYTAPWIPSAASLADASNFEKIKEEKLPIAKTDKYEAEFAAF
ncbi:hypothetical protein RRG08_021722 [Elysia crispata]|uniref:cAMP-dependent protein kinase n=1 Tax=Elysia crispata TaxID=231223 RepID=A0AAE0ZXY8_9GAST|nr:hypothetical protein RRG08_021722 [Elysia crispata]